MIFKKDLTALKKNISTIGKKVDNLLTAFEKEQTKAPKPSKSKAVKAKLDRKAPVKKKTTKETATDQVLKIINRSKKGVNIDTLKKKTGCSGPIHTGPLPFQGGRECAHRENEGT